MKTAKFWINWNDTQTLIKLKDGETINLSQRFQHEEGYTNTYVTYYREKGRITCEEVTHSRDCDGRYEDHQKLVSLIGHCPNLQWHKASHFCRDYSAETAGY